MRLYSVLWGAAPESLISSTRQPCGALHNPATLPYTGNLLSNVDSPVCFRRVSHTTARVE